jgi:hypothetical protein
VQSVSWQARRAARLKELGFADLAGYLQRRYREQGWPVKRMRAELGVGYNWLVAQMAGNASVRASMGGPDPDAAGADPAAAG